MFCFAPEGEKGIFDVPEAIPLTRKSVVSALRKGCISCCSIAITNPLHVQTNSLDLFRCRSFYAELHGLTRMFEFEHLFHFAIFGSNVKRVSWEKRDGWK